MPTRNRRIHTLGAFAAAALLTAFAAPAAQGLELGVQDDGAFLYQQIGSRPQALSLAEQVQAKRIRVLVFWNRIAGAQATARRVPKTYRYDFRQLDGLAAAAAQRGLKLQLVLTGKSPAYATANHRVGNFKPDPKLYAAWVKAVAARYKGRGYRYSLWNEPNFIGWLQPLKSAPQLYRPLVVAGYKAIKRADPSAQVLVGELASFSTAQRSIAPLDFLKRMRCSGCARLPGDGFAYHPYDLTHAPSAVPANPAQVTIGTLPRLYRALDSSGVFRAKLPVYLTEWGYATSGRRAISPDRQAQYTAQALQLASASPRVRELVQYGLYTRPGTSFDTGIVTTAGLPLPALTALQTHAAPAAGGSGGGAAG
ncbi:MAG TPA: hypothetical protein VII98_09955 [Solirubrobacteraceae bacterium]